MNPGIEIGTNKRILNQDRKKLRPGIRKRPRYLTSWEESFRRLPNPQKDETQSLLSKNTIKKNQFGLVDLFGRNRWVRPTGLASGKVPKRLPTTSIHTSCKPSDFFTLRMEHRTGGALAKHAGEERVLLFRSDRAGAIAKIVFSSNPVRWNDSSTKSNTTEKREIAIAANAKVHVLFVKDDYRGFNLGGLLFKLCTTYLKERYSNRYKYEPSKDKTSIRCQLDAEEDVRRHDKLVHFYEHLGLKKRKRAKTSFINNNDGETYRRIPMKMDLLLSSCQADGQQLSCYERQYSSFLPALLVSSMGDYAKVEDRSIDSWVIAECEDGTIELRTTDGRFLKHDARGRCKLVPTQSHSSTSGSFQLLRVSDTLEKVLWNREEEDLVKFQDAVSSKQKQEKQQNCGSGKELWMLRSPSHGRFLGITSDRNLVASAEASFWQVDEDFCLTHTSDSPARRQHHRRMWRTQSVVYVSKMREKHSTFALCTMSIQDALDLTQNLHANPFAMAAREGICSDYCLPSIRTLLFHTAELARREGHPDWVQFIALVHGLAGSLTCAKLSNYTASILANPEAKNDGDSDFDWTVYVDARVIGCKTSEHSTFHEFRHLNPDDGDPQYNTKNGLYREHVGLENVLLSWTSAEYMYHMLKHNRIRLPEEAYAILKLFPLVDWHKRGKHTSLSSEADGDVKPFVVDFYELFKRSREAVMNSTKEMSESECRELWTNHYSLIANKYGAGGILEW